jgi:hypothetical protein
MISLGKVGENRQVFLVDAERSRSETVGEGHEWEVSVIVVSDVSVAVRECVR